MLQSPFIFYDASLLGKPSFMMLARFQSFYDASPPVSFFYDATLTCQLGAAFLTVARCLAVSACGHGEDSKEASKEAGDGEVAEGESDSQRPLNNAEEISGSVSQRHSTSHTANCCVAAACHW